MALGARPEEKEEAQFLLAAGMSYGQMTSELADARAEIALLRQDMQAINQHFISWASGHNDPARRTP